MDARPANRRGARSGLWTRGLLIDHRNHRRWRPGLLHHLVSGRDSIDTLVKVEGHRWAIEDNAETAKDELGLDRNEDPLTARLASPRRLVCWPSP